MSRFISISEAAGRLLCGRTTVYKLLNDGLIEGRKNGRSTLIDGHSIDHYLAGLPAYQPSSQSAPSDEMPPT